MKVKSKKQKFVVLAAVAALLGSSTWVSDVLAAEKGPNNTTKVDDLLLISTINGNTLPNTGAYIVIGGRNQLWQNNNVTSFVNTAIGSYNTSFTNGTTIGLNNHASATAIAAGRDSAAIGYGTAFGSNARAAGGIAIGNNSVVGGMVGYRANGGNVLGEVISTYGTTDKNYSIALGNAAQATSGISIGGASQSRLGGLAVGESAQAFGGSALGNRAIVVSSSGNYMTEESSGAVALGDDSYAKRERYNYGYIPKMGLTILEESNETNDKKIAQVIGGDAVTVINDFYNKYGDAYNKYLEKTRELNALHVEYQNAINEANNLVNPNYNERQQAKSKIDSYSSRFASLQQEIDDIRNANPELTDAIMKRDEALSTYKATSGAVSVGRDAIKDSNGKIEFSRITRQITDVAAGTQDTDAVNVAQLKGVTLNFVGDNLKTDVTAIGKINLATQQLAINGDGTIVTEASNNGIKLSLDKTAFDKLLSTSGSWTLQSMNASKDVTASKTVKPQSKVNFVSGSFTDITVQGTETETNVTIGLNDKATQAIENVNKFITTDENGSNARLNIVGDDKTGVKVEAQKDGSTKVSLDKKAQVGNITIDGTTADDGSKTGEISGLTNTNWITNNPNYKIKDDRAATEGQLSKLTESIAGDLEELNKAIENNGKNLNTDEATIGGNTTINEGGITINNPKTGNTTTITGDSITTNTVNAENLVVGGNTYITKDGINANNQTITNVAPGRMAPDSMEAVNGSQLYAVDQKVNSVGSAVNRLSNRVDKVAAGSAALAALHPLDFDSDDKLNFAVGFGGYKGEHAAALGAFYRANDDLMFSLGATIGNSNDQYNAGVSFRFGDSSPYTNMSKSEMANTLEKQNEEIETLKDRLAKLEALVAQK